MHRFSTLHNHVPRLYPIGIERMAGRVRSTLPSHKPVTIALARQMLAARATQNIDSKMMRNFQRMLMATVRDWRRRTEA